LQKGRAGLIGAGEAAKALGDLQEARQYLSEALKTALESNQIPYVLDALTITAELLVQTNQQERAAEVIGYILNHHAATHVTRSHTELLRAQLESHLAAKTLAAAIERSRSSEIEKVVQDLLENELAEPVTLSVMPVRCWQIR
jgi:uncharacterized protein HemY